jgi:hypothetical protein
LETRRKKRPDLTGDSHLWNFRGSEDSIYSTPFLYGGNMKKIFNSLKSRFKAIVMLIGGVYLFLLFTASTDIRDINFNFGPYFVGLAVSGIYIYIVVIKHHSEKIPEWGLITIAIFFSIYMRWFQLSPSILGENDYDNASYTAGIILVSAYIILVILVWFAKNHPILRAFLFVPTILVFCINLIFAWIYFPSLSYNTRCNEASYYISQYRPLSDPQWSYWRLTEWKRFFNYESYFVGNSGVSEIVCDEKNKQTNIINGPGVLIESHGENPTVFFDEYAWAQLNKYQYFLSYKCNNWDGNSYSCPTEIYRLYKCNLDYKSCQPLSIQYASDDVNTLVLEADETVKEILLYDDYDDNPDRKLIFTYSENPRCYVEGCEILDQ